MACLSQRNDGSCTVFVGCARLGFSIHQHPGGLGSHRNGDLSVDARGQIDSYHLATLLLNRNGEHAMGSWLGALNPLEVDEVWPNVYPF
jgi:hypothetical protein